MKPGDLVYVASLDGDENPSVGVIIKSLGTFGTGRAELHWFNVVVGDEILAVSEREIEVINESR